jgi:GWxTD domain-containing protein
MEKTKIWFWAFIILENLLLFLPSIRSQSDFGLLKERDKGFYVDYAGFKETQGENWRLEVYYKIFNDKLSFVKSENKFQASYELALTILDKDNQQITASSIEEDYLVDKYEETTSSENFLVNQMTCSVPSGEYKARIKLTDLVSHQSWMVEKPIQITDLGPKKTVLSGIEFAQTISEQVSTSKFNKNGKEVIPSVSRIFGEPVSKMFLYYEIYPAKEEDKSLILKHSFQNNRTKRKVRTVIDTLENEGMTVTQFDSLGVGDLPEEEYTLTLELLSSKNKSIAAVHEVFWIEWSILSFLKTDYLKAVEQLRYIASPEEMEELKKAKEEERLKKWTEFWKSKDPTPGTPENELMNEYFRRIKYANLNFSVSNKKGYLTDMGRIYVIYGHPDEVERYPFEMDKKPSVTWYYYKNNIEVLFVDETGTGEYELKAIYEQGVRKR